MADKTHTVKYKVEVEGDGSLKAYKDTVKESAAAAVQAGDDFDALSASVTKLNEEIVAGKGMQELNRRIENTLDTIVEFGGTIQDQRNALRAIEEQARRTGMPIALVAKAAEKLADEADDGAVSSKHLATALDLARVANLKTEDSAALVGRALKGETDALRKLGPAATRVADAIDKIPDANERAAATVAALNSTMSRGPTAMDKMSAAAARVDVQLAQMGIGGELATTVVNNLALAVAGGVVASLKAGYDAWVKYNEATAVGRMRMKRTADAQDRLQLMVGRTVDEVTLLDEIYDSMVLRVEAVTRALDRHGDKLTWLGDTYDKLTWLIPTPFDMLETMLGGAIGALDHLLGVTEEYEKLVRDQSIVSAREIGGQLAENALATFDLGGAMKWLTSTTEGYIATSKEFVAQLERELQKRRDLANEAGSGSGMVEGPFMESGKFDLKSSQTKKKGGGGRGRKRDPLAVAKGIIAGQNQIAEYIRTQEAFRGAYINTTATIAGGAFEVAIKRQFIEPIDLATARLGELETKIGQIQTAVTEGSQGMGGAALLGFGMGREEGPSLLGATGEPVIAGEGIAGALGTEEQKAAAAELDAAWTSLAQGGLNQATTGMIGLVGAMAEGTLKAKDFGKAIMGVMGDTLQQMGMGMILMGTGIQNIEAGITNPAALITVGAGMVILGGAMKGFASRKSGGGGGSTAGAVQRGFSEAQDRFKQDRAGDRELVVNLMVPGFERLTAKAVNRGAQTGAIPSLS